MRSRRHCHAAGNEMRLLLNWNFSTVKTFAIRTTALRGVKWGGKKSPIGRARNRSRDKPLPDPHRNYPPQLLPPLQADKVRLQKSLYLSSKSSRKLIIRRESDKDINMWINHYISSKCRPNNFFSTTKVNIYHWVSTLKTKFLSIANIFVIIQHHIMRLYSQNIMKRETLV